MVLLRAIVLTAAVVALSPAVAGAAPCAGHGGEEACCDHGHARGQPSSCDDGSERARGTCCCWLARTDAAPAEPVGAAANPVPATVPTSTAVTAAPPPPTSSRAARPRAPGRSPPTSGPLLWQRTSLLC